MAGETANMQGQWSEESIATLKRLKGQGLDWDAIAAQVGKTANACRFKWTRLGQTEELSDERSGDSRVITGKLHRRIRTLDELVEHCEIDTDEWLIDRWVCNAWEMGAKDATKTVKVTGLFQIKAWLKRRPGIERARTLLDLFSDAAEHAPKYEALDRPAKGDHLAILPLEDHHFGKLCWAPEVGMDYDLHIAERLWKEAVTELLCRVRVYGLERIVMVCGNDLLNSDNPQGGTTGGTPQDNDGRIQKAIRTAAMSFVWAVEQARTLAPVHIVSVPGNHDALTSFCIAMFLWAWFRDCPDVTVDIEPACRKYIEYGCNLIGFQHGDGLKPKDAPLTMATEMPQAWGRTSKWEFLTGHLHHEQSIDIKSVVVRICKSLVPPDAWHKKNGYGARRGSEAFVYHKETGPCGHLVFNA